LIIVIEFDRDVLIYKDTNVIEQAC